MAIVKEQYPYEYLVRFNPDGTVRGQHIKYLDRVYDNVTNEIYAEKEGDALSVGDATAAVMLDNAIGAVNAALAKAEETERTARAAKEQELDLKLSELEAEKQRRVEAETELQTERAARQQAESQKDEALAELERGRG